MENLLKTLEHYEPLWLIIGIYGEALLTAIGMVFSTVYIAKRLSEKRTYKKKKPEWEELNIGEMK